MGVPWKKTGNGPATVACLFFFHSSQEEGI